MDNWVFYIIIGLVILSLFSNQTQENFQNIDFLRYNNPYWATWPLWSPWNQPTRFPRLFYDIYIADINHKYIVIFKIM